MTSGATPAAWHYVIGGLTVRSAIELPLDPVAAQPPDVDVTEEPIRSLPQAVEGKRLVATGDDRAVRLLWPGLAGMEVEAGRSIRIQKDAGVSGAEVAPLVLGVGLGLAIHQRGRLVLHASAVGLPDGAVAFVGVKGAGKSTMAAALASRGHAVVTDDALPVDLDGNAAMAWPGPAALKLWPESAAAVGRSARRLRRLHPAASKRVVGDLPATSRPVPLRAIYALFVGDEVVIQPMRGQEAILELIRHSYAARFVPSLGATPSHFGRCARIAAEVPIFNLVRPASLDALPDVAAALEAHAAGLSQQRS
jgi:hypothetical protein